MKSKTLSIISWVLALVVLGFALVYYNFVDKKKSLEGVAVGDVCPDFSVETVVVKEGDFAMSGEEFNLNANSGKVRVINFWATWCSACIHELPYFDEFAKAHPEVEVVAICGSSGPSNIVTKWMNDNKAEWKDFSLTFGFYGPERDLYTQLGGTGFWPTTIVVDETGVIRYTQGVELDVEKLENIVLPLLND